MPHSDGNKLSNGERTKDGKFYARWNKCENEMIKMSRAWDKEEIWVPDTIRTYDLPNTGQALYPLELRSPADEPSIIGLALHDLRSSSE